MKKKQKIIILLTLCITPISVLLLLCLVNVMNYFDIHLIGRMDMWLGIIATIWSGSLTVIGVIITIFWQGDNNKESKRLEYMPILGFSTKLMVENEFLKKEKNGNLMISKSDLCTSGFPKEFSKKYTIINVCSANNKAIYGLHISDAYIFDGMGERKKEYNNPLKYRILSDKEYIYIRLYYECYKTALEEYGNTNNIFGILRFSYEDLFCNKYNQDIFITIEEREDQYITIDTIKQPLYTKKNNNTLVEEVKEYDEFQEYNLHII